MEKASDIAELMRLVDEIAAQVAQLQRALDALERRQIATSKANFKPLATTARTALTQR